MTALEAASVVVPIVILLIGVALLAYGLVAACAWDERRARNARHSGTRYVRSDRWGS